MEGVKTKSHGKNGNFHSTFEYISLNTHSNFVDRFELAEVLFVDEGNRE